MSLSEIINPQPGSIFWTIITFIILLVVLKKMAWGPIIEGLRAREGKIREDLETARKRQEEAEKLQQRYAEMLKEAQVEAGRIQQEAQQRAKGFAEEQKQQLREELEKLRSRALADIEAEREKALDQVRGQAVELITAATRAVLGQELKDAHYKEIVDRLLKEMKL